MTDVIPASNQLVGRESVAPAFTRWVGPHGSTTHKYSSVSSLGAGSFGKALLVRRTSDSQLFVAKSMALSSMSEKDKLYVKAEIQCLAACDHFAVVKYVEDFVEDNHLLIVMEYADAGDLNMQIKERASSKKDMYFQEHEIGFIIVQLAMAVDHIHRRRMLHRDIKGANVMLAKSGLVKLGDFGFSHQYESTVSGAVASTFCGTPYYLAPELWNHRRYSKKADVWAMGILLFEMMALRRPYSGQGMKGLAEAVMASRRDCALPSCYSPQLRELCESMLQLDPNNRPSCAELFLFPHMIKLLKDFEGSVERSKQLSETLKKQIYANIEEIRNTNVNDREAFTYVGQVGTVSTTVYHEGNVRKESTGTWKDRFLVLRDGHLVISRGKGEKEAKPLPVSSVSAVITVPAKTANAPGVFVIKLKDAKELWFQSLPPEDSGMWVHKMQQAMGVS